MIPTESQPDPNPPRRFAGVRALLWLLLGGVAGVAATHGARDWNEPIDRLPPAAAGAVRWAFLLNDDSRPASEEPIAVAVSNEPTFVRAIRVISSEGTTVPRSYTGVLRATRASDVGFKSMGRVEAVLVDEGDIVAQGQTLVRLDTAEIEAELRAAEARRDAADATLRELRAGPRSEKIAAARAAVEAAESARDRAKSLYDRSSRLVESNAIARQEYDNALHDLGGAENTLDVRRQELAELEAGVRAERIEAQEAVVLELDAAISALEIQLQERELHAPFDAVVSSRLVDEGKVVSPAETLLRLVERLEPEAWVGLPIDVANQMRVGDRVEVTIGETTTHATLKAKLPETELRTRTLTAIFTLDGGPEADSSAPRFATGQVVQLLSVQPTSQKGFWAPLTALSRGPNGLWSVYLLGDDGQEAEGVCELKRSDVEVVRIDGERALIRGTLTDGAVIVESGVQKLTPGQRVRAGELDGLVGGESNAIEKTSTDRGQRAS